MRNNFDFVICGHIHQPVIKKVKSKSKSVIYLNSGDWIENMTALEYNNKKWSIFNYNSELFQNNVEDHDYKDIKTLFSDLVKDITITT